MLLLIGVTIIFIVGLFLSRSWDWEIGVILSIISGFFIIILLLIWGCAYMGNSNLIYRYEQNKLYLSSIENNKKLTSDERNNAIKIVMKTNNDILKTKRWKDNWVIGMYYSSSLANLQLFDVRKIPEATKKQSIDLNK